MLTIHTLSFYLHILFGSAALLLFWIPMTVKKGSLDHKKYGQYYRQVMYIVALSGLLMSAIVLIDPFAIHGDRLSDASKLDIWNTKMRVFYSLLLFLSVLTITGIRHGQLALATKRNKDAIQSASQVTLNGILIAGSAPLFYAGLQNDITLAMIFSILGLVLGVTNLRYTFSTNRFKNDWLIEHFSGLIGTAIGAYTAFFAFGGRTLIEGIGQWQIAFWILPGVLGSFVIRHYASQYKPAQKSVTAH